MKDFLCVLQVAPHEACGCPLSNDQLEETTDLCCVSKRNCTRHYCWEKLRRAQIDGERVRQVDTSNEHTSALYENTVESRIPYNPLICIKVG